MNRNNGFAFPFLLVLFVLLTAVSCTKPRFASSSLEFVGVYSLVSVDGKKVPASVNHGGTSLQVLSGIFTINIDGTCSSRTVFVPPAGNEVVREVTADYTRDGSRLTMQWQGAGKTVGTVQGDVFTMDNEGMVFVYRK